MRRPGAQREGADHHAVHEQRHAEAAVPERALDAASAGSGPSAAAAARSARPRPAHAPAVPDASAAGPPHSCGNAMIQQATRAADCTPSCTGSEPMPIEVAFDRLEIVQRHDAVRADAVERGQRQRARHPASRRRPSPPRRSPTPGLRSTARRRHCPTSRSASAGTAARCRPRPAAARRTAARETPRAEHGGDHQRQHGPDDRDVQAPATGHAAGRDRAAAAR